MRAVLHTDGGSRGNPGPSGCGFSLVPEGDGEGMAAGCFLGTTTNNVAEYSALVWGMRNALAAGVDHLSVCADSQLMCRQVQGAYKVKSADLLPLYHRVIDLVGEFESFDIEHVYRSSNADADALANEAMDAQATVGTYAVEPDFDLPSTLFDLPVDDGSAVDRTKGKDGSVTESTMKPADDTRLPHNPPAGSSTGADYLDRGGVYELTVTDHFDAAHALPGYDGPCRFLHGHTWDVEVTLSGSRLDDVGMLYDFKDIKRDLSELLAAYDHHCINDVAPFDTIAPTAEHMARVLYHDLAQRLPEDVSLVQMAVWESPAAKVVYRPE